MTDKFRQKLRAAAAKANGSTVTEYNTDGRTVWPIITAQVYRVGQKGGHRLMTIILSIPDRYENFFTGRFLGKFALKWISKIPPHLALHEMLSC